MFASHGLFSKDAYKKIADSCIEQIIVTNSIPLKEGAPKGRVIQLSVCNALASPVATLIAETIRRIAQNESIMSMFL